MSAVSVAARLAWRHDGGDRCSGARLLIAEVPVALAYRGCTHAVMMATPTDLEDFAIGFSLTEGLIAEADEVADLRIAPAEAGIVIDIQLARAAIAPQRRRRLAGVSGCGLCGVRSLAEAARPCRPVDTGLRVRAGEITSALAALQPEQAINRATGAAHAAGFWRGGTLDLVREDVGRHNALDKLVGALARQGRTAADGIVLLTSRVSVEMVQKAAAIGAGIVVAVSAPTALAVELARAAGMTLITVARADGFEIMTHPQRVILGESLRRKAVAQQPERLTASIQRS